MNYHTVYFRLNLYLESHNALQQSQQSTESEGYKVQKNVPYVSETLL